MSVKREADSRKADLRESIIETVIAAVVMYAFAGMLFFMAFEAHGWPKF